MHEQFRPSPNIYHRAIVLMVLGVLMGTNSLAWGEDKAAPARTPKLREIVEIPEDYLGKTFTHRVRISTRDTWMQRGSSGDFFIFVQDAEGTRLPSAGISPGSTVNYLRFVLPKDEGRKLIGQLNAGKLYDVRIRFTIDRERAVVGTGWLYLARISSVELP